MDQPEQFGKVSSDRYFNGGLEQAAEILDGLSEDCKVAAGHAEFGAEMRQLFGESQKYTGVANKIRKLKR